MKMRRSTAGRNCEGGVVITLVAVVVLFVVGAMAVLAIDVATFYTAKSEAQLAADAGALAGARVLANSGTTSDPANATLASNAQNLASTIATQVAMQSEVGGRTLQASEVSVTVLMANGSGYDPQVTVQVTRSDLPTYFARIWGNTIATVTASAMAEAFNASGGPNVSINGPAKPVAPTCVKPWLLPNMDGAGHTIFDPASGTIQNSDLLGSSVPAPWLVATCASCGLPQTASAWQYFPGNPTTSFQPVQAAPACSAGFSGTQASYQESIAGCVQTPVVCGANSSLDVYTAYVDAAPDQTTADAVNCLTHSENGGGDILTLPWDGKTPFQFQAGADNPVVPPGTNTLLSDSLVTIPVANVDGVTTQWTSASVQVVGFVQMFLNPGGTTVSGTTGVPAAIVNLIGCGTDDTVSPLYGNGTSAVVVRLIHP